MSDLHLELEQGPADFSWIPGVPFPDELDPDVIVLAGDIHRGVNAIHWATLTFPETPVILVPGNHEFYRRCLPETLAHMRTAAAQRTSVRLLDNDVAMFGDVRILGATLWTDFLLYGKARKVFAMRQAGRRMNDFQLIHLSDGHAFTPQDSVRLHRRSLKWLIKRLSEPFNGKTVVVTHHLPSALSIHPRYEGQLLNTAFASHLDHLMTGPRAPALWIHGHTHASCDYVCGNTRVVCNPRGYVDWDLNGAFKPHLVVEV